MLHIEPELVLMVAHAVGTSLLTKLSPLMVVVVGSFVHDAGQLAREPRLELIVARVVSVSFMSVMKSAAACASSW